MIRPVDKENLVSVYEPLENFSQAPMLQETSSLQSLHSSVTSIFTILWNFIKNLFGYGIQVKPAEKPKLHPNEIEQTDPFQKTIFTVPKNYELICNIFSILGQGTYLDWLPHLMQIERWKVQLQTPGVYPLEFLTYIFFNKESTQNIVHFQEQATRALFVNPWDRFINEQINSFERNKEALPQHIPGFCKLLKLDEKKMQSYVVNKQWKELIITTFNERKKQFSL